MPRADADWSASAGICEALRGRRPHAIVQLLSPDGKMRVVYDVRATLSSLGYAGGG